MAESEQSGRGGWLAPPGGGTWATTDRHQFCAGVILLVEQPVRSGDRVALGSFYGDIIASKGRSTWVRTGDNAVIIVPNSEFVEKQVTNWTANDWKMRAQVPVGVSYGSDPTMIRKILLQIATLTRTY
ncbi:MAG: mechanosensitive ion channel [Terriglobia bacterium]|nr:mechanosensitive ion channel [Terriglobia bacterium]